MARALGLAFTRVSGSNCQLSIPTTDTKFRPKATGARNESSTVSNFIICPTPMPDSGYGFQEVDFLLYSIDGTSHDVSCTAVNGVYTPSHAVTYSTKVVTVSGTDYSEIFWNGADFGGTAGGYFDVLSVTCLLAPQAAISYHSESYAH
ncbi:hypothetical protein FNZ56_05100 [Pseudoluteimonas lycopersici]|uniref:Uncharacterized protein n=1 Tax=Pseudoluteimonas lycopersici TaxID=1324796 RepID=A0A516V437_9GAMM|nr:hypothetical protein [Lysobacter lycopersici]QDQ73289.1 hypothetical protein FNZ56_05100 [Lysobacter lycopersici]